MRKRILLILAVIVATVLLVPAVLVWLAGPSHRPGGPETLETPVRLLTPAGMVRLSLEEYLVGVLAAEMPVEFQSAALQAQAVAARTYALRRLSLPSGDQHHPNADLCSDPTHCQGWLSTEEMRQKWGSMRYLAYRHKLEQAVRDTRGLVLTYQGKLIEPAYHANAGGRTEDAGEVWQTSLPYLASVASPWDRQSPSYLATASYSFAQLDRLLGTSLAAPPASVSRGGAPLIAAVAYTQTGRLKTVRVGSKVYSGIELRNRLGLNSTNVRWQVKGDRVVFTTAGKGHGVGLSQYGANGMAGEGKDFRAILSYYYSGVQIQPAGVFKP